MARGVYVFDIAPNATKQQVKEAIKRVYKVDAARIHVAKIPNKKTRNLRTGTRGMKGGGKKAYVYLKKGDQISVM
jgi:large subunit ribosomal protein L23